MKKLLKFILFLVGFRYILSLLDENVHVKEQITKLRNELANLETEDLENKITDFFKKYDTTFRDTEDTQKDS
jgi:hypothetical protein